MEWRRVAKSKAQTGAAPVLEAGTSPCSPGSQTHTMLALDIMCPTTTYCSFVFNHAL